MNPSFQHDITDFKLGNALNSIGRYAIENNLSPEQVKAFFDIGIISHKRLSEVTYHAGTPAVSSL
jgi:hypothetical protein